MSLKEGSKRLAKVLAIASIVPAFLIAALIYAQMQHGATWGDLLLVGVAAAVLVPIIIIFCLSSAAWGAVQAVKWISEGFKQEKA